MKEVWEAELDAADALELEPLDQEVIFFGSDATLAQYGDPRRIWPRYVRRMEFRAVAGGHSNILFATGWGGERPKRLHTGRPVIRLENGILGEWDFVLATAWAAC